MTFTPDDVRKRDAMAEFFHARGMHCLPSSPDEKKPLCRFREFWDAPAPHDLMARFPSPNLQILLGRPKGLMVLDLDGIGAVTQFAHRRPRTWVSRSGGEGTGEHWWFRLPPDLPPMPKAVLWTDGGKHSAAERLCDKSLAMAPPSIHPVTGRRYAWLDKGHSPAKLGVPAMAPGWLLAMPDITPKPKPVAVPFVRPEPVEFASDSGHYRSADVIAAIPDIPSLVASWGIRFGPDTGREWMPCHAFDREDRTPSAAISRKTGGYVDKGSGLRLGLFDLAVTVGGLGRDWKEAAAILGERYRARAG